MSASMVFSSLDRLDRDLLISKISAVGLIIGIVGLMKILYDQPWTRYPEHAPARPFDCYREWQRADRRLAMIEYNVTQLQEDFETMKKDLHSISARLAEHETALTDDDATSSSADISQERGRSSEQKAATASSDGAQSSNSAISLSRPSSETGNEATKRKAKRSGSEAYRDFLKNLG